MKNKRIHHISKIMPKRLFLPKTFLSFFQMQQKLKLCQNLYLIIPEEQFLETSWILSNFIYFTNFI